MCKDALLEFVCALKGKVVSLLIGQQINGNVKKKTDQARHTGSDQRIYASWRSVFTICTTIIVDCEKLYIQLMGLT